MKILFIYKYGVLGGVTTQLVNRLKYLGNYCEPHFAFLSDHGGRLAFGEYPNTCILSSVKEIAKYINNGAFNAVISIDTYETYEALKFSNYKGTVIHEVHTTYPQSLVPLFSLKQEAPMDYFITPSNYIRDKVNNEIGFSGIRPVYCVENCLDLERFKISEISSTEKNEKKIILWIGKLDYHKNWESFLSIAGKIAQIRDGFEFWLVGGYTNSTAVQDLMKNNVSQYGLQDVFKWFPCIEYRDMPNIYAMAAKSGGMYISTSTNESFGMTIAEAMACGCPVVAPKVGAIPELLNGDLLNCLYVFGNEEECIDIVNDLSENTLKRTRLINEGVKKVKANYSIQNFGQKYMKLLHSSI